MQAIVWNAVFFVFALSILVAVHEWGHYIVAKICKVKILRFSIGFGKPIYKRVTSSGMEFVIAAIPLGGYVKMLDGRVQQIGTDQLDSAFDQKPVLQRMAIVFAGPLVNFLFAVFVYIILGMIGSTTVKPIIGEVLPNSYASQTEMRASDEIIAIDDHKVNDWQDVNIELVRFSGYDAIPIELMSESGQKKSISLPINGWKLDPDSKDILADLGFTRFVPRGTTELAMIAKDLPADDAGLLVGDKIIKLDGTSVANWRQIVEYIEARPNVLIEVEVNRQNSKRVISVLTTQNPNDDQKGYVGFAPKSEPWPEQYLVTTQLGLVDAIFQAVGDTWRLTTTTLKMLAKLFTGNLSIETISGPISIAQGAGAHASYGVVTFLSFLALISVNLGIINLLPLPVLDGGHLMYFMYELITGKPVSESVQEVGFRIGAALLFVFMVTALFNDISRNI